MATMKTTARAGAVQGPTVGSPSSSATTTNNDDQHDSHEANRNNSNNQNGHAPPHLSLQPADANSNGNANHDENAEEESSTKNFPVWKLKSFLALLITDMTISIFLILWPALWPKVTGHVFGGGSRSFWPYTLSGSWLDVAILSILRCWAALIGPGLSYAWWTGSVPPHEFHPFNPFHRNGVRKTREELEEEALEEDLWTWFKRFVARPAMMAELLALVVQVLGVVKSLARLNVEMGLRQDQDPFHPWFWIVLLYSVIVAGVEASWLDSMCQLAAKLGHQRQQEGRDARPGLLQRINSSLSIPLLSEDHLAAQPQDDQTQTTARASQGNDDEEAGNASAPSPRDDEDVRGVSDITSDTNYKATWSDLFMLCYPDMHLISCAFCFLFLAATAQVYIPRFLGKILDALAAAFHDDNGNDDHHHRPSMFEIPGFLTNVKLLVLASVLAGVFAGLRGSIFTVVGARVNVRLRVQLLDSLFSQDQGFFDVTKTGDITSRLSSDTTLVGDQVSLNVNVFLRSLVQALGVLAFMFMVSWQLSILAFISVPVITLLSKWYGEYVRALTKLMQKKLADGNSVCEASLSSMSTVRAFDAAESDLKEFETLMGKYLALNRRSAVAYIGFAGMSTALPQLVFAVIIFYGGLSVRNGDMTSGQLVSFLLYLQSLSDAFANIGWVFSSLTQAVGAADKVFELMHRKPRITPPSVSGDSSDLSRRTDVLGIHATKTRKQRSAGLRPSTARGEIELREVDLYYPARPKRRILNKMSLKIEPGSIVALVGQSGGGKSSVMSLIQHLYEQSSGLVLIDGIQVHELCPQWLSRHVSIVSQEPTLFAKSIKRNIMYGLEGTDTEPSEEEIEQAAKLANAHEFIMGMPDKYETEVGERGVQLSGGQKQRIAIARALVRKPKILLLDEATSALDAESEHLVQSAIDDMLARGKSDRGDSSMTVIIVAHRLSTVRSADRIFVIKEGQVVEHGNHNELIQDPDGAYSALIRRQMEAQERLETGGSAGATPQEG